MTDLHDLPVIELAGSPTAMGLAFGELCRDDIQQLYELRMQAAIQFAQQHGRSCSLHDILNVATQCIEPTRQYDPNGYDELAAIATAANLSVAQLLATNGLTDLRDVVTFGEGCSSFIVAANRTVDRHTLVGQNWDLQTDNMPFVRLVIRRPDHAPATISVTLVGCLSLIGLNSEGIAIGNTNLKTRDARPGVQYLSIIHRALQATTLREASQAVTEAPRAGGHYYYLADRHDNAEAIECSATQHVVTKVNHNYHIHCNHALTDTVRALEAGDIEASTLYRQQRLTSLMDQQQNVNISDLKKMLADRQGGPKCICRQHVPPTGISTNAAAIISPHTLQLHACRSQPDRGTWQTFSF